MDAIAVSRGRISTGEGLLSAPIYCVTIQGYSDEGFSQLRCYLNDDGSVDISICSLKELLDGDEGKKIKISGSKVETAINLIYEDRLKNKHKDK